MPVGAHFTPAAPTRRPPASQPDGRACGGGQGAGNATPRACILPCIHCVGGVTTPPPDPTGAGPRHKPTRMTVRDLPSGLAVRSPAHPGPLSRWPPLPRRFLCCGGPSSSVLEGPAGHGSKSALHAPHSPPLPPRPVYARSKKH